MTYVTGQEDAELLGRDVNEFAGGTVCAARRYDAIEDADAQLGGLGTDLTHLYHFATPPIYRQKSEVFDAALFA